MYCNDCMQYFDEAIVTIEKDTGFREALCPCCGSDDLDESHPCKCCGEETVNDFCDNCMENIAEELKDLQKRFDTTMSVLEDLIAEHFIAQEV